MSAHSVNMAVLVEQSDQPASPGATTSIVRGPYSVKPELLKAETLLLSQPPPPELP